jgi:hypothetical protein
MVSPRDYDNPGAYIHSLNIKYLVKYCYRVSKQSCCICLIMNA